LMRTEHGPRARHWSPPRASCYVRPGRFVGQMNPQASCGYHERSVLLQLDSTNIKGHGRNLTTLTRRHRPDECGSFGGSFLQVSELLIGGREYRQGKREEEALRASFFLRFLDAGTSSSVESSLPRCTRVRRLPDQFARCALKVPMNASE
jgi:hypothetical protein